MTHARPSRRVRLVATSAAGLLAATGALVTAGPAQAGGNGCENRTNNSVHKLLECVTVAGVQEHLTAFQGIADAHDGNRASGTSGYTASADYVESRLTAAGYAVQRQEFEFPFYELTAEPTFRQVAPTPTTYVYGTDFQDMSLSGSGAPEAVAVAVDIAGADSGCEAAS